MGPAIWAPDGKSLLYLNLPTERTQLNTIRECMPDTNADKLVAKTSQFAHFGINHPGNGLCRREPQRGVPYDPDYAAVTRRELTLCEHKASHPGHDRTAISPDSQRIYFESDRDGKPAIYCLHVEKLVEKTEPDAGSGE